MVERLDVLNLVALTLEYEAALQVTTGALGPWRQENFAGLPVAFCEFPGRDGHPIRVAVAQSAGMGVVAAVGVLLPLVLQHRPRVVAMSGVCAGHPTKTALGDVVAAERLFFHDTGKQLPDRTQQDLETYNLRKDWKVALEHFDFVEKFKHEGWWQARPRTRVWQEFWMLERMLRGDEPAADPDVSIACPQFRQVLAGLWARREVKKETQTISAKGKKRINAELLLSLGRLSDPSPGGADNPFRVHVASFGSGAQVIENPKIWPMVSEHMRKTLALEMEAAALGALAEMRKHIEVFDALVMKGVMDFADHGRDDHFKHYAARASAECLIAFLRSQLDGAPMVASPEPDEAPTQLQALKGSARAPVTSPPVSSVSAEVLLDALLTCGFFREVARLFDSSRVHNLLWQVGIEASHLPAVYTPTPKAWWETVARELRSGVVHDPHAVTRKLVHATLKEYEANPILVRAGELAR